MAELEAANEPTLRDVLAMMEGQTIVLMRIYDILTVLSHPETDEVAREVVAMHNRGGLLQDAIRLLPDEGDE